jgi:site-specific recombinase XerD
MNDELIHMVTPCNISAWVSSNTPTRKYILPIKCFIGIRIFFIKCIRKTEAVHLRVQDIDFEFKQITVRDGKGKKDRVTPLANNLIVMLQTHLEKIKIIHNCTGKNHSLPNDDTTSCPPYLSTCL